MGNENKELELSYLSISRIAWGADNGQLRGEITFEGSNTKQTVKLDDAKARKILTIIADQLVDNAHELGKVLRANIIPMIEAPKS